MKKSLLVFLLFLTGCASYNAGPLNTPCIVTTNRSDLVVMAKAFDKRDCKKFLDRDVITKGFQPVQLFIQNPSPKSYEFALGRVSLPCATPGEVAQKVHTSTIGRAAGYGAAAVFTCGLFAIPAVVDGIKSSQANTSLDQDFCLKSAKDGVIAPYSSMNALLFVPTTSFQPTFQITLIDQETKNPTQFTVTTR